MFKQDNKQQLITKSTLAIFIGGLSIVMILLILTSSKISSQVAPITQQVSIGPWAILEIAKQPIDGGFTASFQLLPGLSWYIGFLVTLSVLSGLVIMRLPKTSK